MFTQHLPLYSELGQCYKNNVISHWSAGHSNVFFLHKSVYTHLSLLTYLFRNVANISKQWISELFSPIWAIFLAWHRRTLAHTTNLLSNPNQGNVPQWACRFILRGIKLSIVFLKECSQKTLQPLHDNFDKFYGVWEKIEERHHCEGRDNLPWISRLSDTSKRVDRNTRWSSLTCIVKYRQYCSGISAVIRPYKFILYADALTQVFFCTGLVTEQKMAYSSWWTPIERTCQGKVRSSTSLNSTLLIKGSSEQAPMRTAFPSRAPLGRTLIKPWAWQTSPLSPPLSILLPIPHDEPD